MRVRPASSSILLWKEQGAQYIDFYLLHTLMDNNVGRYERYRLWDYVRELKEKGLVRHIGFSFHSGPELLEKLLQEHPKVEFVQLQINYRDWEDPSVRSRANYEVARKYGKPVVVMEPVKGGSLAKPPQEVKDLFTAYHPEMSPASWAIRYVASLEGILAVLSGMSNQEQMRDNLSYMASFTPLNEEEQHIIHEAQRILGNSRTIPCTACSYCTKGCPQQIAIPEVFRAMNLYLGSGQKEQAREAYRAISNKADLCIACKQCEAVCPQHIRIADRLREAKEVLE